MPIAITGEQFALQSSIREWAKRAATIEVVRGQETAGSGAAGSVADRGSPCWASLADLGFFAIGLPAAAGGADGTTADLAAALAQAAECLIPGPVLPTVLAGQLLAGPSISRWPEAPAAAGGRRDLRRGRVRGLAA